MLTVNEALKQLEANIVVRKLKVFRNKAFFYPNVARIDSLFSIFQAYVKSCMPPRQENKVFNLNVRFGMYSTKKGVKKAKSVEDYEKTFGTDGECDFVLFSLDENGMHELSGLVGNAQGMRFALRYFKHLLCSKSATDVALQSVSWKKEFEIYFSALELFITRHHIYSRGNTTKHRKCYDFSEEEEEEVDNSEEVMPTPKKRKAPLELEHVQPAIKRLHTGAIQTCKRSRMQAIIDAHLESAAETLMDIEENGSGGEGAAAEAKLPALPFAPHRKRAIDLKAKLSAYIVVLSAFQKEVSVINAVIAKHTDAQVMSTASVLNTLAKRVKSEHAPKLQDAPWLCASLHLEALEDAPDMRPIERDGKRSAWCREAVSQMDALLEKLTSAQKALVELLETDMGMGPDCAFSFEYEENLYNETCAHVEATILAH